MLVGVIGKSGSGKSTLIDKMKKYNEEVIHVDIDKVGHDILQRDDVVFNIVKIVGDSSVVENGVINRKKVGNIIFKDESKYEEYFKYTEKIEYEVIDSIIENNKDKIVILDWAVLFKTKYFDVLDCLVLVETPYEIRKQRVTKRDSISNEYFDLREMMYKDYIKEANFVIDGTNITDEVAEWLLGELV